VPSVAVYFFIQYIPGVGLAHAPPPQFELLMRAIKTGGNALVVLPSPVGAAAAEPADPRKARTHATHAASEVSHAANLDTTQSEDAVEVDVQDLEMSPMPSPELSARTHHKLLLNLTLPGAAPELSFRTDVSCGNEQSQASSSQQTAPRASILRKRRGPNRTSQVTWAPTEMTAEKIERRMLSLAAAAESSARLMTSQLSEYSSNTAVEPSKPRSKWRRSLGIALQPAKEKSHILKIRCAPCPLLCSQTWQ
jgi:hypothetical protein